MHFPSRQTGKSISRPGYLSSRGRVFLNNPDSSQFALSLAGLGLPPTGPSAPGATPTPAQYGIIKGAIFLINVGGFLQTHGIQIVGASAGVELAGLLGGPAVDALGGGPLDPLADSAGADIAATATDVAAPLYQAGTAAVGFGSAFVTTGATALAIEGYPRDAINTVIEKYTTDRIFGDGALGTWVDNNIVDPVLNREEDLVGLNKAPR